MRQPTRLLNAAAMGSLCLLCGRLVAAESATLVDWRGIYARELSTIQSNGVARARQVVSAYGESLAQLEQNARQAGALEPLQRILAERERFARQGIPATDAPSPELPELRALQSRCAEARNDAALRTNQEIVRLTEQYLSRVEALKRDLTRQGDLLGAQAAANEATVVASTAVYQAALFALAERAAATSAARPSTPPPPAAPPVFEAVSSSKGVKVYAPGELPPLGSASLRALDVRADIGEGQFNVRLRNRPSRQTDERERLLRFRNVSVEATVTTEQTNLQLALQHCEAGSEPALVCVEYFAARTTDDVTRRIAVHLARLDALSERIQYLEFPTVSTRVRTTEVNRRVGDDREWSSGKALAGVVITVYSPSGTPTWRGATDAALLTSSRGWRDPATPSDEDDPDEPLPDGHRPREAGPLPPKRGPAFPGPVRRPPIPRR